VSTRAITPTVAPQIAALTPVQGPMLQRACDCGQHTGGGECEECKKKQEMPLQRHSISSAAPGIAPPIVHHVLRSPGQSLDREILDFFEPRFGRDLSHVRVHSGAPAAESAAAVNALAYTRGNHIVFGSGQYAPASIFGRRLLGHELTHTVQQSASANAPGTNLEIGGIDTAAEHEAESAAEALAPAGPLIAGWKVGSILQRQTADTKSGTHGTRPEDFGITLVVVDHGAAASAAAAKSRLEEVFTSLRPDNLTELQKIGITRIEMHIVPYDKKIIELPEFKHLKGTKTPDGRLWDDVRGAGSDISGSTMRYAVAEEDLPGSRHSHGFAIGLGITGGLAVGTGGAALGADIGQQLQRGPGPGGLIGGLIGGAVGAGLGAVGGALLGNLADQPSANYGHDFLATHESSHNVEDYALTPDQHKRLEALFQSRKSAGGPWLEPADYTSSNIHEYFAQCAAAYFSKPYEDQYKSTYNPEWLRKNDLGMYELLSEIFGTRAPGIRNDILERQYRASAVG
jgi:hypothetical protein